VIALLAAGSLAGALAAAGPSPAPSARPASTAPTAVVERRLAMMGTTLELRVEAGSREGAIAASERAVAALEATAARLSTWRDDSELARLNRAPAGRPVAISPALAADLAAARRCWRRTAGAFDPTVGALAAAWGIRAGGRVPAEGERRAALAATGMAALDLEEGAAGSAGVGGGAIARRLRPDLVLDEGGFGKGAGLDRALAALAGPGIERAWLDLGGQVAVATFGDGGAAAGAAEVAGWRLAVADPADRGRPAIALRFDAGSVATSGTAERGRHLLDPRRGRPAADFGSLTAWAATAVEADCLSTGLYVLGPERALAWAAARPGEIEALVLSRDGGRLRARATPGLQGRLAPLVPEVEIEFVEEFDEKRGAGGTAAP
jgi:thiamine biosynthesis lipoprotein